MDKLSNITRGNYNTYFETKDGSVKFPLNLDYITYQSKVDLNNNTYIADDETSGLPTINELIVSGQLVEKKYVEEYMVALDDFDSCEEHPSRLPYRRIINEFKKQGFNVTKQAIKHNYDCWLTDLKSGYRDDENDYHLFTPCGCNKLTFTASKLDKHFEWQHTYYA